MDFENYESDNDILVDNLSAHSGEDNLPQFDSESDFSDDEIFVRTRNRVLSLQFSDSESENEEITEWSETDNPPNVEPFTGDSGVRVLPNNGENISDVIKLFIGDDLFQYMTEETNRYHAQNESRVKDRIKSLKWKDVTVNELKKFLGLLLLMGKIRKDNKDEYWSTDPTIQTPIFSQVMSRDRFKQIWAFWHFSNNSNIVDNSDRLQKIRPILTYLASKFTSVYTPQRELSLDENIIPWRGRLAFKVYNASKIIKYGVLVRMVCEATTGYICNLEIYCGQGKPLLQTITTLLEPYVNLWHHMYMDNYYNSVQTCEILLQNKIRCCGTIRINRGLPESLKNVSLTRGDSTFRCHKDILLQCWQSKRQVRMISTIHSAEVIESHNIDWNTKQNIWKPQCVIAYKKYTKGVDRADQYLAYYSIIRRTKKWTKRVIMYLLNCALFNAFQVFRKLNPTKTITYKQFLHEISKEWINDRLPENTGSEDPQPSTYSIKRTTLSRDPPGRLSLDLRKHEAIKIITGGKKKIPQRQCRVCAVNKKKSLTSYMCKFCQIPLHRGECFQKYHTLKKY